MKTCCNLSSLFIAFIAMFLSFGTLQAQTTPTCTKAQKAACKASKTTCTKTAANEGSDLFQKVFASFQAEGKASSSPANCAKICAKKPNCKPAACAKTASASSVPAKMVSQSTTKPACTKKTAQSCSAKKASALAVKQ